MSGFNLTLPAPAGIVAGDLLLALVDFGNPGTITVPSGWSVVPGTPISGSGWVVYLYQKTATASEPSSYTWTITASEVGDTGVIVDYENGTIDVIGSTINGAASTSITAPSVTTTEANDAVICMYVNALHGSGSIALPGGLTSRANNSPTGSTESPMAIGDFVQAVSGATPTETATVTNYTAWSALTVALKGNTSLGDYWDNVQLVFSGQ
jgi:hypothetical protein